MVTDVKLINYKIHRDFQFSPNGKSFAIVGDSGTGKSTLIDVILMSLGVIPFDKKCLSDGAESGRMEVTHDFGDGNKYTVKRRFSKKGVMRFEVTDQNGGDHTMEVLLGKVLGKAFTNTYFDYRKYFHDCKTSAARFEYMVRAVGGDVVLDNNRTINRKIDERNTIGGKRSTFETLLEQNTILDPDKLDEQEVYYAKLKTLDDIYEDETYKQLESQLIQKESLELDLEIVSESNDKYKKAELREVAIDTEIAELERQIRELKAEKKDSQKWRKQNPADFEFEKELAEQIAKADEQNAELYPKIKQAKDAAQERINTYNYEYNQFNTGLGYLQEFLSLNEKWNTINDSIEKLREDNDKLFRERLAIPEITITEDDVVMYTFPDGVQRELALPNVSKGQSVGITAKIQSVLNPKGLNMIMIPEGKSMGSGLDEVIAECNNLGIQYIVEITERKKEVKIVFEEKEFLQ